jgi:hypothetical protein
MVRDGIQGGKVMKYEEYRSMLDGLGYRMREVVLKDVANDPELNIEQKVALAKMQ